MKNGVLWGTPPQFFLQKTDCNCLFTIANTFFRDAPSAHEKVKNRAQTILCKQTVV